MGIKPSEWRAWGTSEASKTHKSSWAGRAMGEPWVVAPGL